MKEKKIVVFSNVSQNVYLFKMLLLKNLKKYGYKVIVVASDTGMVDYIEEHSDEYISYGLSQLGVNLFKERETYKELKTIFDRIDPDLVMSFTIKPNIYSNLILGKSKTKIINVLNGRGRVFDGSKPLRRFLIGSLCKLAYKNSDCIYLNNQADFDYMTDNGYLPRDKSRIIKGEGLDLTKFTATGKKSYDKLKFLFIGRLLKSKGVEDFVYSAIDLKQDYPHIEIYLAGTTDGDSDSMSEEDIKDLEKQGKINYLGWVDNPTELYDEMNCIVLPTYYNEGMPMTLMEAAAMKTPIICSDIDACKQTVEDGVTGYMCKAKNRKSLKEQMLKFINLSDREKDEMGENARRKAEKEFDANIIFQQYHEVIKELLAEDNN
jgi:galacturonosyltransferase